jgi:predicted signal transduction protein with EAL and GGDEF domain
MTTRRESRKIVASVVGLGQSLGLLTIAEGVETQEQADLLFWMGCDVGQGWLFGRPVPSEEFADPLASHRTFPICLTASLSEDSLRTEGPPGQRLAQLQAIYDGAPSASACSTAICVTSA